MGAWEFGGFAVIIFVAGILELVGIGLHGHGWAGGTLPADAAACTSAG